MTGNRLMTGNRYIIECMVTEFWFEYNKFISTR